jgi:hypothetical protein
VKGKVLKLWKQWVGEVETKGRYEKLKMIDLWYDSCYIYKSYE